MITKEAILHIPKSNFSYAYDDHTLHIRIRTKKNEVKKVFLRIGDPYNWKDGGLDGGNLNGGNAHGWRGGNNYLMTKELETDYFDYWFCEYIPPKKRSRYAFILENEEEKILVGEKRIEVLNDIKEDEEKLSNLSNFFSFPYINSKDILKAPKWAKNTIWYQIFPERFANGNKRISPKNVQPWGTNPERDNFMGGDLYGLYNKLEYLEELGITGIYLCPIFYGKSNHKYDTINYYDIDPHFGDKTIFKKLIQKAHDKGMKLMLDAVFNHVGSNHPFWIDVMKNKKNSKYAEWFVINNFNSDGTIDYETFANVKEMPKLNLEHPECREYLLQVAEYWIKEFDIDGWRLDVCNEIDHKFWREFRERCKKLKKDLYILGEIWHDSLPWLMGDQFDAVMNYPISDAILDFLKYDILDIEKLKYSINKAIISYPKNVNEINFNLLDSHDTTRVLTVLGENKEKLKLALALMFFQTGSPCIYYGTEIGMTGEKNNNSESNRGCMVWEENKQDKELLSFIKKLIIIKKENKDLQLNNIEWKFFNNKKVVAIKKNNTMLLVNTSDEREEISISEDKIYDMILDKKIELKDKKLKISSKSFFILKISLTEI